MGGGEAAGDRSCEEREWGSSCPEASRKDRWEVPSCNSIFSTWNVQLWKPALWNPAGSQAALLLCLPFSANLETFF